MRRSRKRMSFGFGQPKDPLFRRSIYAINFGYTILAFPVDDCAAQTANRVRQENCGGVAQVFKKEHSLNRMRPRFQKMASLYTEQATRNRWAA